MDKPRPRPAPQPQSTAAPGDLGTTDNDFTVDQQDLGSTEAVVEKATSPGSLDSTQALEGAQHSSRPNMDATQGLEEDSPARPDSTQAMGKSDAPPAKTGSRPPSKPASKPPGAAKPAAQAPAAKPSEGDGKGGAEKVSILGDFKLIKELGAGGMGKVYKAHQVSLDRPVALKVMAKHLAENKNFVERFQREARIQAKLDHPNIVRGYWVGEVRGLHLFAMEFIDGGSVQGSLKKLGRFSVGDAVHITLAVGHAMAHAHELNMIHRDIKPDNVMLTSKGVVKVADLGLAKALDEDMSLTQSGMGAGTPYYMSPEQAADAKHVDGRTDIYAIGCMLYVFLTGEMPFKGNTTLELIKNKEIGKFPPVRKLNPDVPERLDLMIEKMLQKKPDHRYQTCAEMIADLESLGLANATLSFVPNASGRLPGAAPTPAAGRTSMRPAAQPTMAPTPPKEEPAADWWYLEYRDEDGEDVHRRVTSNQLHELIKYDKIPPKAQACREPKGEFRPLATFREFEPALRARLTKAKADRKTEKVRDFFQNIEQEEKRYKRGRFFRKIFGTLGRWVTFLLLLGVLAGVGFALWWFSEPLLALVGVRLGEVTGTKTP